MPGYLDCTYRKPEEQITCYKYNLQIALNFRKSRNPISLQTITIRQLLDTFTETQKYLTRRIQFFNMHRNAKTRPCIGLLEPKHWTEDEIIARNLRTYILGRRPDHKEIRRGLQELQIRP